MTPQKRTFLLDANVFIEAKRRYYAFDLCPGFWDCLISFHAEQILFSIDRVKKELKKGKDDLARWAAKTLPSSCFVSTDDSAVIDIYGKIVSWVYKQRQFTEEAKAAFAKNENADGWLIACAKAQEMVVVTHEVFDPAIRKKVPIPNVCREFSVPYVDTFEMLRHLRVRFQWKP